MGYHGNIGGHRGNSLYKYRRYGVCFLMENMFINISQMHNIYVSAMRDQI